ncbi:MAG: helix-turn-helix domain-containing protein [Firmicutes bacterium]|jgi:transcriptional regulator with XRE-family HTH domain|uniref:Helix-turn-helix domain-containing protein n=1 Tax=Acetobacterium malicum TaxID=52692 RepID=A0ABR6YX70_9FIRM|nr:helix-turn-helix transcriptional regulator [Acetobacterium malicum]MBC3899706.1 helix-turn-helix domain-containing protein [Acetobacterium malicum]MBU4439807.1 helix-turn-helix domain-containing protein [Bacillota bacterium]PKM53660.1 MAG: hypothetical protein CVV00_11430 [Firmicutes bacterium HGW-Firmicutes-5]PKM56505.1 MAG: hypothetical protein CVU98_10890 [Firmicutes bacterium HGW-Firmicutes-3]
MKLVYTEKLKDEREKKGYSYAEMSKLLGYKSPSTYMYIEKGKTTPKLNKMIEISRIFNKPLDYFFNLSVQDNWTKINDRD